jgi:O-phosphoseryl-tRNA(Cys) synthetase
MDGVKKRTEFRRLPTKTQEKLNTLFTILKMLPDSFVSNEVGKDLKEKGVGDYQRYILMLYQGGFLTREDDVRKFTYSKSELAKKSEGEVANAIMDARQKMFGYNQANPALKQRAKKAEAEQGLRPITCSGASMADEEVEEHEEETAVVAPAIMPEAPPGKGGIDFVSSEKQPLNVFAETSNDFEAVKSVLPNLTVKDFIIMWLMGSGKA